MCGIHESKCTGGGGGGLPPHRCRKCGDTVAPAHADSGNDSRKLRGFHESRCRGTTELNKACQHCDRIFEDMHKRTKHEGACSARESVTAEDSVFWTCECGWKQIKTGQPQGHLEAAVQRHKDSCRGSMNLNLECSKCKSKWLNIVARKAHESQCRGSGDASLRCLCCNKLFNKVNTRNKHEQKMRRNGMFPADG